MLLTVSQNISHHTDMRRCVVMCQWELVQRPKKTPTGFLEVSEGYISKAT